MTAQLFRITIERVTTRNRALAGGCFRGMPPRGNGWRAVDIDPAAIAWERTVVVPADEALR